MVQEIITYIIIAAAVVFTFLRIRKKFGNKKRVNKNAGTNNDAVSQHKCSDCSAECILRDVTSDKLQSNGDLCKKIETASSD